ncbi:MAG: TonB-dependent receptor plug domain-containing protein, partial [Bacteroidetes bacterium]|nr:TonB-dependent receptor plug domain-containing protein [Bacteroidota bacterium]
MKQTKKILAVAISTVLAASLNSVTFAEEAADANAKDEQFSGVETIVITASKREESLQESGISVTTIGETELQRMGANTLIDFAVKVPNLGLAYEADGQFDSSSPAIRGIFGTNTTGFYIDDTPVNSSILPRVMDVSRIEVLRGPQGSLYGAKSMGGTIRMITVQPDLSQFEGSVHVSGSTVTEGDNNSSIDAIFNVPVNDMFALRVTAYSGQNSGIYDREYQSSWVEASSGATIPSPGPAFAIQENVDDEKYWGGQIAAKIVLTDNLTFTPKYMYQKIEADGLPFADNDAKNTTQLRFFNIEEPGTDEWSVLSGTLNWDTDAGSLVSTTSRYDRKTNEAEEETKFLQFLFN